MKEDPGEELTAEATQKEGKQTKLFLRHKWL
jgi:hypothetical protein